MTDQSEKAFDADLFNSARGLATRLGYSSYHVFRPRGSKAGFPDRTIWRDRLLFAELKTMAKSSQPTELQVATLTELAKAGAEVYLWRPSDMEEIGQILGRRWTFQRPADIDHPGTLTATEHGWWTPGSLWTPEGERFDDSSR